MKLTCSNRPSTTRGGRAGHGRAGQRGGVADVDLGRLHPRRVVRPRDHPGRDHRREQRLQARLAHLDERGGVRRGAGPGSRCGGRPHARRGSSRIASSVSGTSTSCTDSPRYGCARVLAGSGRSHIIGNLRRPLRRRLVLAGTKTGPHSVRSGTCPAPRPDPYVLQGERAGGRRRRRRGHVGGLGRPPGRPGAADRRAGGHRPRRVRPLRAALPPVRPGRGGRPVLLPARLLPGDGAASTCASARRATGIDLAAREVTYTRDGRTERLGYSTRSSSRRAGPPGVPPIAGLAGRRVFTVRTIEDTGALRSCSTRARCARPSSSARATSGWRPPRRCTPAGWRRPSSSGCRGCSPRSTSRSPSLVEAHVREHVDLRLATDADAALAEVDPDVVVVVHRRAARGRDRRGGGRRDRARRRAARRRPDAHQPARRLRRGRLHRAVPPRARQARLRAARPGRQQDRTGGGHGRGGRRRDVRGRRRHGRGEGVRPGGGAHRPHARRGEGGGPARERDRRRAQEPGEVLPGRRPVARAAGPRARRTAARGAARRAGRRGQARRRGGGGAVRGPRRGRPRGVRPLLRAAVLPGLRPAADRRPGARSARRCRHEHPGSRW